LYTLVDNGDDDIAISEGTDEGNAELLVIAEDEEDVHGEAGETGDTNDDND
jgi:hypothetical protein